MTQAELFESSQLALGNALEAFAVFISMMGAYLTVAYLIGNKLDKLQVIILNSIFIISIAGMTYAIFGYTSVGIELYAEFVRSKSNSYFQPFGATAGVNLVINIAMIIAALKFMRDIRKSELTGA